jgi:hypothetical protein
VSKRSDDGDRILREAAARSAERKAVEDEARRVAEAERRNQQKKGK